MTTKRKKKMKLVKRMMRRCQFKRRPSITTCPELNHLTLWTRQKELEGMCEKRQHPPGVGLEKRPITEPSTCDASVRGFPLRRGAAEAITTTANRWMEITAAEEVAMAAEAATMAEAVVDTITTTAEADLTKWVDLAEAEACRDLAVGATRVTAVAMTTTCPMAMDRCRWTVAAMSLITPGWNSWDRFRPSTMSFHP